MKTTAVPIRVAPAFSNREEIDELFLHHGAYQAAAARIAYTGGVWSITDNDAWITSIYKIYTAASRASAPSVG
jgi:hypothetical protein